MFAFNMPARQAIVPQLVPRHKMMNAISLQMGGQNLTRVVAPAMAGGLVAPLGVGWVYILVAIFFSTPLISEWRIPDHGMTTVRKKSARVHEDFAEALRYIRNDGLIHPADRAGARLPALRDPGLPTPARLRRGGLRRRRGGSGAAGRQHRGGGVWWGRSSSRP